MAQPVKASVTWAGNLAFEGESGSGHGVRLDSNRELGASPMELMLLGMGACSSVDVVMLLQQAGQDITACRCELNAVRAEQDPKIFIGIHAHFLIRGRNVDSAQVSRAIRLSSQKYGSGWVMLSRSAEMTHDFEVLPA
jgi:putative redox protein